MSRRGLTAAVVLAAVMFVLYLIVLWVVTR